MPGIYLCTWDLITLVADSYVRNLGNALSTSVLSSVFRVIVEPSIIQPFAQPIQLCFNLNIPQNVA